MDEKALFKLLGQDGTDCHEQQIRALQTSMSDLMSSLAQLHPEAELLFTSLTSTLNQTLDEAAKRRDSVMDYFTGYGQVAKRLRQHIAVEAWINKQMYSPTDLISPSEAETFLTSRLDKFNYDPITDEEEVRETMDFLNWAVQGVRCGSFTTPYPQLPKRTTMETYQTGLYSPDGNGANTQLILRVPAEKAGGVETLFAAFPGTQPLLWHYHPHEDIWIISNFQQTFAGLKEGLADEFDKALAAADQDDEGFDFAAEVVKLEQEINELFDSEHHFPSSYSMELQNGPVYVRGDTASSFSIRVNQVTIGFMNTGGAYPSRSGARIFTTLANITHTLTPGSVPYSTQRTLIQRGKAAVAEMRQLFLQAHSQQEPVLKYAFSYLPPAAPYPHGK